jgi:hypothetical protein
LKRAEDAVAALHESGLGCDANGRAEATNECPL